MESSILNSDKCCKVHADGLSTEAIRWAFETHGLFILDLVGKSYPIVKQIADELISEFPSEIFEVEFSNGGFIKSNNFPESKITLKCPF
jgi:hypothetical protein